MAGVKVSVTFNVHNERLTSSQFLCLENRILLDIAGAKANPHRFSMNIAGDLNVPPPGSDERKLDTPSAEGPAAASPREMHTPPLLPQVGQYFLPTYRDRYGRTHPYFYGYS